MSISTPKPWLLDLVITKGLNTKVSIISGFHIRSFLYILSSQYRIKDSKTVDEFKTIYNSAWTTALTTSCNDLAFDLNARSFQVYPWYSCTSQMGKNSHTHENLWMNTKIYASLWEIVVIQSAYRGNLNCRCIMIFSRSRFPHTIMLWKYPDSHTSPV